MVLKPNTIWTTDITYIRTQQGWLYLCVMLDLFSRRVVGWQTSHRIDGQLVCDTFNYAMAHQSYSTENVCGTASFWIIGYELPKPIQNKQELESSFGWHNFFAEHSGRADELKDFNPRDE